MRHSKTKTGRFLLALLAAGLLALLAGCGADGASTESTFRPDGAWAVYWDTGALMQADAANLPEDVVLFECFFHENGTLVVPDEIVPMAAQIPDSRTSWLSFTNDVADSSGDVTEQKSVTLLGKLFENDASLDRCAEEIVAETDRQGVDGIELDFENLGQDQTLWNGYVALIRKTQDKASAAGLVLRVVLPANAPVDTLTLPGGPTYVVMCYNLYGTGTGPGPKADRAFLKKLARTFRDIPNIRFALANGGFDWKSSDSSGSGASSYDVSSVTTAKAESLASSDPKRDDGSGALTFRYQDDDGVRHTVWYADSRTLRIWRSVIRKTAGKDVKIDLWRLESAA